MFGDEINKLVIEFFKENAGIAITSIGGSVFALCVQSIVMPKIMANLFSNLDDLEKVKKNIQKLIFAWLVNQGTSTLNDSLNIKFDPTLTNYVTNKLMGALFLKYKEANSDINTALILNHINQIRANIDVLIHRMTMVMIPRTITISLIVYNFFKINRQIGTTVLTCLLIQLGIIFSSFDSNSQQNILKNINLSDDIIEEIDDKFANIEIINSTKNGISKEIEECKKLAEMAKERAIKNDMYLLNQNVRVYSSNVAVFIILLNTTFSQLQKGKITTEQMTNIFISINTLFDQMSELSFFLPDVMKRRAILMKHSEFVKEIFDYQTKDTEDNKKIVESIPNQSLVLENVSFTYKKKKILDNFSLSIDSNDFICIYGPSGSGKSTLTKLMLGHIKPQSGKIVIGGIDTSEISYKVLKKLISYVPQNTTKLFNKTIYENIIYGSNDSVELRKQIKDIFNRYNLTSIFYQVNQSLYEEKLNCDSNAAFDEYSFLDYNVGKNGGLLSGGQKQIIHIIRCFLNKESKIIILDEPTTALDTNAKKHVLNLIQDINNQRKTVLIISHDKDVQNNYCKKTLVFSNDAPPKLYH